MERNHAAYKIVDREIMLPLTVAALGVTGDNNSRILKFQINQYIDGIDLSTKNIFLCYKNAEEETEEQQSVHLTAKDSVLTFEIAVPCELTKKEGLVTFYIEFRDAAEYVLRTKSITQQIEESFEILKDGRPFDYMIEDAILVDYSNRIDRLSLIDTNLPIKVKDKDILMPSNQTIAVIRDNMSQILTFRLKRIVDGIDRKDMTFLFFYENAEKETDGCFASNIFTSEDEIYIGWALDSKVTKKAGNITFRIGVIGNFDEDLNYRWYTKNSSFEILDGLDITGKIEAPVKSWFESWVLEADNILKQGALSANEAKQYYNQSLIASTKIEETMEQVERSKLDAQKSALSASESVNELLGLSIQRADKDENGYFSKVDYFRIDGSLYMSSLLQNKIQSRYTKVVETCYDTDGQTIKESKSNDILYDDSGSVLGSFNIFHNLLYHGIL